MCCLRPFLWDRSACQSNGDRDHINGRVDVAFSAAERHTCPDLGKTASSALGETHNCSQAQDNKCETYADDACQAVTDV